LLDGECLEHACGTPQKLVRGFEAPIAIGTNEECGRFRTYTIEVPPGPSARRRAIRNGGLFGLVPSTARAAVSIEIARELELSQQLVSYWLTSNNIDTKKSRREWVARYMKKKKI
jgi:hypothetical protein